MTQTLIDGAWVERPPGDFQRGEVFRFDLEGGGWGPAMRVTQGTAELRAEGSTASATSEPVDLPELKPAPPRAYDASDVRITIGGIECVPAPFITIEREAPVRPLVYPLDRLPPSFAASIDIRLDAGAVAVLQGVLALSKNRRREVLRHLTRRQRQAIRRIANYRWKAIPDNRPRH